MNEPLMYVVLIGLLIIVFSSFLPKYQSGAKADNSHQIVKEMEETMEGFLAELEEDNQKLIDTMTTMKKEHESAVHKLADRIDSLDRQFQEQRQEIHRIAIQRLDRQEAECVGLTQSRTMDPISVGLENVSLTNPNIERQTTDPSQSNPEPQPMTIKSRYQELFRMHEEGKSIEYIAKKSGMNKGEVSLIIQLSVQEDHKGVEK